MQHSFAQDRRRSVVSGVPFTLLHNFAGFRAENVAVGCFPNRNKSYSKLNAHARAPGDTVGLMVGCELCRMYEHLFSAALNSLSLSLRVHMGVLCVLLFCLPSTFDDVMGFSRANCKYMYESYRCETHIARKRRPRRHT